MTPGELLADRYQLAGVLGTGGMGEVHRAYDTHLGRYVALKLFPRTDDVIARRRFDNEIHLLASLAHPNLVTVYDAATNNDDTVPFVALRLIDGPTLRDRIIGGPLPVDEVRSLGACIAEALAYVHDHGVVHRDIKPSNILLDGDGTPYLADFGLAWLSGSSRLTRHDELVGTAAYLAPEQVRGAQIGPPADIYALGLVRLEALSGRREYGGSEIEAAVARLNRPPMIPRTLPGDLTRLLALMTSLTPRRRPTAAACAQALRGHTTVLSAAPAPTTPTRVVRIRRRHRTAIRVLAAAAVGAVSLAGLSWMASGGTDPVTSPPAAPVQPTDTPAPAAQQPQQPAQQPQPAVVTHTSTSTATVVVTAPVTPRQPAANAGPGPGPNKGKGKKPDDDHGKED